MTAQGSPQGNASVTVDGKTTAVIGGTSGIGKGIALGFAEDGADVVTASGTAVRETAEKIRERGARTVEQTCDVTDRESIVEDLLDSAEELVHVDDVLMDREFDSQHVLEMISQRGLSYVVPKRMQTSEKAQEKWLLQRDQDRYETDRELHLGKDEWHETTLIYHRK